MTLQAWAFLHMKNIVVIKYARGWITNTEKGPHSGIQVIITIMMIINIIFIISILISSLNSSSSSSSASSYLKMCTIFTNAEKDFEIEANLRGRIHPGQGKVVCMKFVLNHHRHHHHYHCHHHLKSKCAVILQKKKRWRMSSGHILHISVAGPVQKADYLD